MNNLTAAATEIIRNSIVSSIYIDDKIYEPFSEASSTEERYYKISKGLFESFRKENKSIDFYKYSPEKNWLDDAEYLFKNRDLLVLDWQLNDVQELKQEETLKILKKAVQTDNLHFVSIYTETNSRRFSEIFYTIKSFFSTDYNPDSVQKCGSIIEQLDNEGIDTSFFHKIGNSFLELALELENGKKESLEKLKSLIQLELKDKYRIFARGLKGIHSDIYKACEIFGFYINKESIIDPIDFEVELKTDYIGNGFIVINHTIIQITNKQNPEPPELFQFFTQAVQNVCGNLLTLISLEVRTLLRESSGFIGKDADNIKDVVLFHQLRKKASFFDFLMSIIKSHALSYFDYKQGRLKSVTAEFWEEYNVNKGIEAKLEDISKAENELALIDEIKKLNVYYNSLHIVNSGNHRLKFGDVFYTVTNGTPDGRYFLCVTAHCDCLEPEENIKNNFFFISGEKKDAGQLVKLGDSGFCSYLKNDSEIIAINWNPRPVVIKITNNKIEDRKLSGIDGLDKVYEFIYHSTLKENYTQRMANNSFAHAMRVGIDFASL
jgi:hypothetical protein